MRSLNQKALYRVIDANFNRAKEGLRVCEDICRFILNRPDETKVFKLMRHRLADILSSLKISALVNARDSQTDVGKGSVKAELKREKVADIFYANCQRVKESVRVLEEFLKLMDKRLAQKVKLIRYELYAVEKEIIKRL